MDDLKAIYDKKILPVERKYFFHQRSPTFDKKVKIVMIDCHKKIKEEFLVSLLGEDYRTSQDFNVVIYDENTLGNLTLGDPVITESDIILIFLPFQKLDTPSFEIFRIFNDYSKKIKIIIDIEGRDLKKSQLEKVFIQVTWRFGKIFKHQPTIFCYEEFKPTSKESKPRFELDEIRIRKLLFSLSMNANKRKITEIGKRARVAKTHAFLIHELGKKFDGSDSEKKRQIKHIDWFYEKVARKYKIDADDFPDKMLMQEKLRNLDFAGFPRLDKDLISKLDLALSKDLPELIPEFPTQFEERNLTCEKSSNMMSQYDEDILLINNFL